MLKLSVGEYEYEYRISCSDNPNYVLRGAFEPSDNITHCVHENDLQDAPPNMCAERLTDTQIQKLRNTLGPNLDAWGMWHKPLPEFAIGQRGCGCLPIVVTCPPFAAISRDEADSYVLQFEDKHNTRHLYIFIEVHHTYLM